MTTPAIPEGVKRCPTRQFTLWLAVVGAVLLWGVYAMFLIWYKGLNQTGMNDAYGFALWIWADLAVIALGGGAFFTGFLTYIIGKKELKSIINYAVIIGFICYSSALLILALDIGQPLRGWFIFWHANVHSMLTEVAFCLSCYFAVLTIEFIPLVLENPKLDRIPFLHHLSHNLHEVMAVFAATGVFLSFFHQGSLGGVAGVLYGRPFAFREGLLIWPWTFFLFTWSAAAVGPCFTMLITWLTEKITQKKLVRPEAFQLLAKISGWMLLTYMIAKIADTWYWAAVTAPSKGFSLMDFYSNNPVYGIWILIAELVICGIVPALILITRKGRENKKLLVTAAILAVLGVCINRWVMVLQVMAAPLLPFHDWYMYMPTWQEVATTILPVAYGAILISLAHRYLPVFPHEKELNPGQ
ncbi:molybdopterin-containing oxidoreductase family membrane subunit [Desulfosalsimonas propionicica]|uniref:Molybdopterin-containing oxidoreductase family membrane subunit n=1 Tax=Desulfosalsimonas propionicica TaxID=332175 RepID=A0A7W0CA47_9BACT|nr:menaquinone reductase integral membrane subunit QrcD [Desulfosalsimonas propionicica]MBA2881962.1 molybdopterin-containing oxidoreductase family membrane subunit [Desulfosalsimonas propionicica]